MAASVSLRIAVVSALFCGGCGLARQGDRPPQLLSCAELEASTVDQWDSAPFESTSYPNWTCIEEADRQCRTYACVDRGATDPFDRQCDAIQFIVLPVLSDTQLGSTLFHVYPTHPLGEGCLTDEERAGLFGWVVWEE